MSRLIVVGGGPAGMAAALAASGSGAEVLLLERNEKLGKKLYITGKGRCNLTNRCDREEFLRNVVTNPKFLYSTLKNFDSESTMQLFDPICPLKVERGNRVFPVSDKSSDVIKAFCRLLDRAGVKVRLNARVRGLRMDEKGIRGVELEDGEALEAGAVIVATGGCSYPSTGSTGDGFRFARESGLAVSALRPALVPMRTDSAETEGLSGLSLKNVGVTLRSEGRIVAREFGEMLFTHQGLSGPCILSLSSLYSREGLKRAEIVIDFKPALSAEVLDQRLLREIDAAKNRQIKNIMGALVPRSMGPHLLRKAAVPADLPLHSLTEAMRRSLGETLKHYAVPVLGLGDLEEGIVTGGGVDVRQIRPSTMEARTLPGLFFCGEVLDVDALTGGFNLQIALSTGWTAGLGAAAMLRGETGKAE